MRHLTILCSLILLPLLSCTAVGSPANNTAVLVISGTPLNHLIDPQYKAAMEQAGYRLDSCRFDDVSWERLSQFNVLILQWIPLQTDLEPLAAYEASLPLLKRFLTEGGGILWLSNHWANNIAAPVNSFMRDYGFELYDQYVMDSNPENLYTQEMFRQLRFLRTDEIVDHPCTNGISNVLLPGDDQKWYAPSPFRVDDNWDVLIRAEASAVGYNPWIGKTSYESSPPLFAVRDSDAGRMAVLPVAATFTVQAGYHRTLEGIVLDRGNVFQLIRNTCDWLAQPTLASGTLGGFSAETNATTQPETCHYNTYPMAYQLAEKQVFTGLIGATSSLTVGADSVADLCAAARDSGIDFLVFTEPMAQMDPAKWQSLKAQCEQESWGGFWAIPGFSYREPDGSTRICFNNKDWVDEDRALDDKGFFKHPGHPMFDFSWPTVALVQSHDVDPVDDYYHALKFYTAFGLFTYDADKLIDDSADRFGILAGDNYWIRPLTYHKMASVAQLLAAAQSQTYKTCVTAPSLMEIPQAMLGITNTRPFGNSTFVSNGPTIQAFKIVGPGHTVDLWEAYYLWRQGDTVDFTIDVASDSIITDVIVYRGLEEYWHLRPMAKHFTQTLPYVFEQGGNLRMQVIDENGRKAWSWPIMVRHQNFWAAMCTDLQNPIQSGVWPAQDGTFLLRNQPVSQYGGIGNSEYGNQLQPTIATGNIIPDGLDASWGGFSMDVDVRIQTDHGQLPSVNAARYGFRSSTGEAALIETFMHHVANQPAQDFIVRLRKLGTPCREGSYNVVQVEQQIEFLRDITLSADSDALPLQLFAIHADKSLFPHASCSTQGRIERVDRTTMTEPVRATLDRRGGVCFYPQYWGEGGVFPIDGRQYDVEITPTEIRFAINEPGRTFRKGEILTTRFLVVRASGRDPDDAGIRKLMDDYGVTSSPAYSIDSPAQVTFGNYIPVVTLNDPLAAMTISQTDLPNNLFVRIQGINPNWSVLAYDKITQHMNWLGTFEDAAIAQFDTGTTRQVVVGNALTCDVPSIRLTLVQSKDGRFSILAHNPSDQPITTVIRSGGAVVGLPELQQQVALEPGQIQLLPLQ
jgi:hypothetical protein